MRRALITAATIVGLSGGLVGTAQATPPPEIHKSGAVVSTALVKDRIIYWPYAERL